MRDRLRLLTDNGPSFASKELAECPQNRLEHVRGKPYHTITQGKIDSYHRTMKNVVTPRIYDMPWELERELGRLCTTATTSAHESHGLA